MRKFLFHFYYSIQAIDAIKLNETRNMPRCRLKSALNNSIKWLRRSILIVIRFLSVNTEHGVLIPEL